MRINKLLLMLVLVFLSVQFCSAQLAKYQALYLYNFTRYVEWPVEVSNGDFTIGIVGNGEAVTSELKDIASKRKVGVQTIAIAEYKSAKDIKECHILFVPKSKMGDYGNCIEKVKNFNTLIVTENTSFPEGGAINLIFDGSKLKYDVNTANANAKGLKVSDKLVAVSK